MYTRTQHPNTRIRTPVEHARTYVRTYARTHARTHARAHTHTRTHARTHARTLATRKKTQKRTSKYQSISSINHLDIIHYRDMKYAKILNIRFLYKKYLIGCVLEKL